MMSQIEFLGIAFVYYRLLTTDNNLVNSNASVTILANLLQK